MPLYGDRRREYARQWMANRRKEWFDKNGPCVDCGSWEDLELDHVDPKQKISHRIWSWAKERREKELAKCVVRCHKCHVKKTISNKEYRFMNSKNTLTYEQVLEIRKRYENGEKQADLAREFGIARNYTSLIVNYRHRLHS